MREKVNRTYQKPDLKTICPPNFLKNRINPIQIITHNQSNFFCQPQSSSNNQLELHGKTDLLIATHLEQNQTLTSNSNKQTPNMTKTRNGTQSLKGRKKNYQFRRVLKKASPYVKDHVAFTRLMSGMKPVKGPTQSIMTQINKHNDLNRNAAQNVIMKKKQSFQIKLTKYSHRIGLKNNQKIFIFNSRDTHIKEALQNNNWIESMEKKSVFFHLKWVYLDNPADYENLRQGQFFNHFKGNQELTNKNLLKKNINKYMGWKPNFPLTYDLQVNEEEYLFRKQYTQIQIYKIIQDLIEIFRSKNNEYYQRVIRNRYNFYQNQNHIRSVLSNNLIKCQKIIQIMLPEQIKKIGNYEQLLSIRQQLYYFCFNLIIDNKVKHRYKKFYQQTNSKSKFISKVSYLSKIIKHSPQFISNLLQCDRFLAVQLIKIYRSSSYKYSKSYGSSNAWIIKPTGVARGSGISIQKQYTKICSNKYGKIVQKYIEKPLLLKCGRKFDIRQWVLVKSFYPLQAYAFQSCYCRFSYDKYQNDNFHNLKSHLTNFSQNKNSFKKPQKTSQSILSQNQLSQQLDGRWPQLKNNIYTQILKTLKCCHLEVTQIDQCFQVYGFDIIIDQDYRPWILEVNMSPACENRAQFLNEYLRKMSAGIINLINSEPLQHWVRLSDKMIEENSKEQRYRSAKMIQNNWRNKLK